MKKNALLLINTFLVLFLFTGCKNHVVKNDEIKKRMQNLLVQHLEKYKKQFPGKELGFGMYIKSPNGNIYASAGFPENMGENIHFRGASTTKTFTSASILKLQMLGKLNIDDLITANIPGTSEPYIPATGNYDVPNKNKITIRLLLQHRAGVFDVTNTDVPKDATAPFAGERYIDYAYNLNGKNHTFTFEELIGVAAKNHLSYFEPGTDFHYSNTGYNMLAVIIERVSGKSYGQFLQDEFLTPFQLNHTTFPHLGTDQKMPSPYLPGWLLFQKEFLENDNDNMSSAVSEGNIITTPADLAHWVYNLYGTDKIVNQNLHNQMIDVLPADKANVNYGLGTTTHPENIGMGHDGVRPAYMTIMRYEPTTKSSYVLFSNFLNFDIVFDQNTDMHDMVAEAVKAIKSSQ